MSFDLFLTHYEGGESAPGDRNAVLGVLRKHCQDPPDKFGFYVVRFSDGTEVELSEKTLELEPNGYFEGCAFHLRDFSPAVITFVYDIAVAGDLVITNAQGDGTPSSPLFILTSDGQRAMAPEEMREDAITCMSAEHLAGLLGAGIEGWSAFRERIAAEMEKRRE